MCGSLGGYGHGREGWASINGDWLLVQGTNMQVYVVVRYQARAHAAHGLKRSSCLLQIQTRQPIFWLSGSSLCLGMALGLLMNSVSAQAKGVGSVHSLFSDAVEGHVCFT